ncbi:MAG: hypothetical protein K9K78_06125 [Spirochaetales bacterium]|nr:hypothetical protein [Spirochaetales bacterium]
MFSRKTKLKENIYVLTMYLLLIIIFLNEFFAENSFLTYIKFLLVVIYLLVSLLQNKGFFLYGSLAALTVSMILISFLQLDAGIIVQALNENSGIIALFAAIPVLSVPATNKKYTEAIVAVSKNRKKNSFMFFIFLSVTHIFLSLLLNIGSIPAMQKLIEKTGLNKRFLGRLYTAGYSSYMVFSPFDGVINMILLFSAVTYAEFIPGGIIMALTIVFISAMLNYFEGKHEAIDNSGSLETSKEHYASLIDFFVNIIVLIGITALVNAFAALKEPLLGTALIVILYSFFWSAKQKKLRTYFDSYKIQNNGTLKFKLFLPFIISLGFLAVILSKTDVNILIAGVVEKITIFPLGITLFLFIIIVMGLSLIGIHMMITIPTLALLIDPAVIGLDKNVFALLLLTSWFIAMAISPFVPFSAVVSDAVKTNPVKFSIGQNYKFSLIMALAAPAVLIMINNWVY